MNLFILLILLNLSFNFVFSDNCWSFFSYFKSSSRADEFDKNVQSRCAIIYYGYLKSYPSCVICPKFVLKSDYNYKVLNLLQSTIWYTNENYPKNLPFSLNLNQCELVDLSKLQILSKCCVYNSEHARFKRSNSDNENENNNNNNNFECICKPDFQQNYECNPKEDSSLELSCNKRQHSPQNSPTKLSCSQPSNKKIKSAPPDLISFLEQFIKTNQDVLVTPSIILEIKNAYSKNRDALGVCKDELSLNQITYSSVNYLVVASNNYYPGEGSNDRPYTHLYVAYMIIRLMNDGVNVIFEDYLKDGRKYETIVNLLKNNQEIRIIKYVTKNSKCTVKIVESATYNLLKNNNFNLMNTAVPIPALRSIVKEDNFKKLEFFSATKILKPESTTESFSLDRLNLIYSHSYPDFKDKYFKDNQNQDVYALSVERFVGKELHYFSPFNIRDRSVKYAIMLAYSNLAHFKHNSGKVEKGSHVHHAYLYNKYKDPNSERINYLDFRGFFTTHKNLDKNYMRNQIIDLPEGVTEDSIQNELKEFQDTLIPEFLFKFAKQVICNKIVTGKENGRALRSPSIYSLGYQAPIAIFLNSKQNVNSEYFNWRVLKKNNKRQYKDLDDFFNHPDYDEYNRCLLKDKTSKRGYSIPKATPESTTRVINMFRDLLVEKGVNINFINNLEQEARNVRVFKDEVTKDIQETEMKLHAEQPFL